METKIYTDIKTGKTKIAKILDSCLKCMYQTDGVAECITKPIPNEKVKFTPEIIYETEYLVFILNRCSKKKPFSEFLLSDTNE